MVDIEIDPYKQKNRNEVIHKIVNHLNQLNHFLSISYCNTMFCKNRVNHPESVQKL